MWAVPWFRQLVTGLILWRTTSQASLFGICDEQIGNGTGFI